jgi:hypothetical protein
LSAGDVAIAQQMYGLPPAGAAETNAFLPIAKG